MNINLISAEKHNQNELNQFLSRVFPAEKSLFLKNHALWWHGGDHNRWLLIIDDKIAGLVGLIPACVTIDGKKVNAYWCVDLIIAREYRGMGLQKLFDKKLKEIDKLKIAFPNTLNAIIHRKRMWGVRDDLSVMLLPCRLRQINQVRFAKGLTGAFVKIGALLLSPISFLFCLVIQCIRAKKSFCEKEIDPNRLSEVFLRNIPGSFSTTYRDANHFIHRYLQSPNKDEFVCFLCGKEERPTHYLIARVFENQGVLNARILDFFGDLNDKDSLRDLIRFSKKRLIQMGVSQISIMITLHEMKSFFRKEGFIFSKQIHFCWYTENQSHMSKLNDRIFWTYADSDNDEV